MVTLRQFREEELSYFEHLPGLDDDPFSYFGLSTHAASVRLRWAQDRLISPAAGTLAVEVEARLIGDVQWHTVPYGPPPMSDCYNIGIRLRPEQRGSGHGGRAQKSLAEYLFATYPVNRIEAHTDVENIAEQKALTKAGFQREGIVRGAQWRSGEWHDLVAFSRLRADDATAPTSGPG